MPLLSYGLCENRISSPTERPLSLLPAEKKGNPLQHSCEECTRLWREFAEATTAHLRLQSKLEIAALSHDPVVITQLRPHVETAAIDRAEARNAIRKHEAAAHPRPSAEA